MPYLSRNYPQHMPLTPPRGMSINQLPPYSAHQGLRPRHEKRAFDYVDAYDQGPAFAPPPPMMYHQPPAYSQAPPGVGHQNIMYGAPISAPVLPPIRVPERSVMDDAATHHQHHQERLSMAEQPKEEKPVGGVAAKLDYDMEQMSEYVAEMSQGIVQPNSAVPPAFRKFVSQILSSTRLPSATILLGLYYLNVRFTQLSANGQYSPAKNSGSQVYRMLTVALLLASKFLDDNTFQNRSWSEVSSISVLELNVMEIEWLVAIKWKLMLDPEEQKGFTAWQDHWDARRSRAASKASNVPKLAPIDTTNVQRQQNKAFSSTQLYAPHYTNQAVPIMNVDAQQLHSPHHAPSLFDQNAWSYARSSERSPPSAPETGPNTPEYYGWSPFHTALHAPPQYSMRPMGQSGHSNHISSQPPSYHQTPYAQYYQSQTPWHGAGCGCVYCGRSNESYFMNAGFGPQPVVG